MVTVEMARCVARITGDGNIYYNDKFRVYRLELAGNAEEDYDYFEQINTFLIKTTGKNPKLFTRKEKLGKSLRIQFNNKSFLSNFMDYRITGINPSS